MKQVLLRLLSILEHDVSNDDLRMIFGDAIADSILRLMDKGYDDNIYADERLKVARLALRFASMDEVAKVLSWKDFERFASIVLREHGYEVYNSYRINRFEIDIIAIDQRLALLIDCKHWRYNSNSMLKDAIKKQIDRSKILLRSNRFEIDNAIPMIVTLYESTRFIDGIPIVAIDKLARFLDEFKGYLDSLFIIKP